MSHAYHPGLPGHDEAHVLHDGCPECEGRAAAGLEGLLKLDGESVRRLWDKMVAREARPPFDGSPPVVASGADHEAMRTLYLLAVLLERVTTLDPLRGGVPWKDEA